MTLQQKKKTEKDYETAKYEDNDEVITSTLDIMMMRFFVVFMIFWHFATYVSNVQRHTKANKYSDFFSQFDIKKIIFWLSCD